jgi:hypothetical protein
MLELLELFEDELDELDFDDELDELERLDELFEELIDGLTLLIEELMLLMDGLTLFETDFEIEFEIELTELLADFELTLADETDETLGFELIEIALGAIAEPIDGTLPMLIRLGLVTLIDGMTDTGSGLEAAFPVDFIPNNSNSGE